jgi:hypothetical protein
VLLLLLLLTLMMLMLMLLLLQAQECTATVRSFGAVKHAQDTASQTAHAGLASAISMHSCTNCERRRTAVLGGVGCVGVWACVCV